MKKELEDLKQKHEALEKHVNIIANQLLQLINLLHDKIK